MWEDKYICHLCISDKYVKSQIRKRGNNDNNCSYCGKKRINILLDDVSEMVNNVFSNYYESYEDPYDLIGGTSAQDVICQELGVDYDMADDIYEFLCERFNPHNDYEDIKYNDDFYYQLRNYSTGALDHTWSRATKSLLGQTRFFNREVHTFLDSLFTDIDRLTTHNRSSPVKVMPADTVLFRARVFEDLEEVKSALTQPEDRFGPPPTASARPGRMNAQGVSVFYGATTMDIAIAEVRPPVGSFVVVVPFVPLRPLRILDISALSSLRIGTGSKFDPSNRKADERASFFKTLSRKLTMPVFGKRLDSDYLITQVISDYLSDREKYRLDGVSFKSTQRLSEETSQKGGYNVVLFNQSSRVRFARDKKRKYHVELQEKVSKKGYSFQPNIQLTEEGESSRYNFIPSSSSVADSLEMKTAEMTFHKITGVKFETEKKMIARKEDKIPPESPDDLIDF